MIKWLKWNFIRKVAMPSNRNSSALNWHYLLLIGQFARTQTLANIQQWQTVEELTCTHTNTGTDWLAVWGRNVKCDSEKIHSVFVTTTDSIAHYRSYIRKATQSSGLVDWSVCVSAATAVGAGTAANKHIDDANISCYQHKRLCVELKHLSCSVLLLYMCT